MSFDEMRKVILERIFEGNMIRINAQKFNEVLNYIN